MSGKKSKKISDEEFLELCKEGTTEEILAAIKAGANVNAEDDEWCDPWGMPISPMTLCIQRGLPELIFALLDAGVDVNTELWGLSDDIPYDFWVDDRPITQLTPLSAAVLLGMSGLVKPLLDRGADPNTRILAQDDCFDSDEGPLLCFIIEKGCCDYEETLILLLDAGADVNSMDANGRTPLRIALEQDDHEAVNLLLNAGADPRNLGELQEATLFELAMEEEPDWIPEEEPDEPPYRFEYLLKLGIDVNEQNTTGITPLMWAVIHRKFEYILLLLDSGADVNLRDDKGRTALMYLYGFNYAHYFDPDQRPDDTHVLDIIDALTGAGAGGAEADEDGMTALMYAAEKTMMPEVLTALLGAGSDPAARDKLGLYAYDYAMKNEALHGTVDFAFLTFSALEKAATSGKAINNNKEE